MLGMGFPLILFSTAHQYYDGSGSLNNKIIEINIHVS